MKLPIIKHLLDFVEQNDVDFLEETILTLENLVEYDGLKNEELDVIGETLSNLYGAIEVKKMIDQGLDSKQALNIFMKRVLNSIDK